MKVIQKIMHLWDIPI